MLDAAVRAKMNILVSGGTGTGKTTLLNVLSAFIPSDERIITIEDAVELQLQQQHVVRLEARPPNIEGRGEITIRDLVRNSLRMRPDRIVVGEVRGAESLDMLQAMNTGHEGSISTLHANSPRDAVARMETLVLMAGMDLPLRAIREQIASAIDIIVQISRHKDGVRRVTHITEVHGMEGDIVTLQDAFTFDHKAGFDAEGRLLGRIEPTGVRPRFAERIADHGIALPSSLFSSRLPRDARRDPMNPVVLVTGLAVCLLAALVLVFFTVAPSPPRVARERRVAPGTEHVSLLTRVTEQTTAVIESATSKRRAPALRRRGTRARRREVVAVAVRRARRLVRECVRVARRRARALERHVDPVGRHLRDPHPGGRQGHADRSNLAAPGEVRRPDRRHRAAGGRNPARRARAQRIARSGGERLGGTHGRGARSRR